MQLEFIKYFLFPTPNEMNKKETIFMYVIGIVCFAFLAFIVIYPLVLRRSLDNNLEYTNAIVTGDTFVKRADHYFGYRFTVGKDEYKGWGFNYIRTEVFSEGDTVLVVYDRTNPNNNSLYRSYSNTFHFKKKRKR